MVIFIFKDLFFNTGFLPTEVFTPHTRSTIETHQEPFYCMLARVKIGGFEMPLHKHVFSNNRSTIMHCCLEVCHGGF